MTNIETVADLRAVLEAAGQNVFQVPGVDLGDRACYVAYEGARSIQDGLLNDAYSVSCYLSLSGLDDPEHELQTFVEGVVNDLQDAVPAFAFDGIEREDDAESGYLAVRFSGYIMQSTMGVRQLN